MGVPLFIAVTGFLNSQDKPTWSYYRKSLKVIVPYFLISILYLVFRRYILDEEITLLTGADMILHFNAIQYAWYVEMWIGLYFLAPFLNLMYRGIETEKTSFALILTLYVMTYVTMTLNREGFQILPNYWTSISPLTCYFIGCHIRKFGVNIAKRKLVLFLFFAILVEPVSNLFFFKGQPYRFVIGVYLFIVPAMAAFFALFYNWETSKEWLRKMMKSVSTLTLEMYLYCAMCDMVLYPFFMKFYTTQSQFGLYFFAIIPLELLASFCLAWVTDRIIKLFRIERLWNRRQ